MTMANNFLGGLNPDMLMALSSGLLSGRTASEQVGGALGNFATQRQQSQQRNATMDWLQKNNPELLPMLDAGMSPADLLSMSYKQKREAEQAQLKAQTPQRQWVQLPDGQYGWADKNSGQFNPIGTAVKPGSGGGPEYGLNPQYGVDAEGNPVLIQLGKDGTSHRTPLPDGVSLSKEPIKIDAGTHFILLDPITRQPVGRVEKDLAGAEAEKAIGKGQGDAAATYQSMTSKMPGLELVVNELEGLADKATYTAGGQLLDAGRKVFGMDPRDAAIARAEYIAKVDNQILPLLRDTFGAQFTQKEGETLRATLGDADKQPAEKKAILRAFIEQKRRDVEALGRQSGAAGQQQQGGVNRTQTGATWRVK